MSWTVKFNNIAEKQLIKLDKPVQRRIVEYLEERIENCKNPKHFGEPLKANKSGLWRYRVGDYRIICEIRETELVILALAIGHRREIYKS